MKNLLLFIIFLFSAQTHFSQSSDSQNKTHILIPPIYQNLKDFSEGLAPVKKDGKWGFVDKYGVIVIEFKYQDAEVFSEGLAGVKLSGNWGFIDAKGQLIIPHRFKEVKEFKEGIAAVNKNGFWGGINTKGDEVIPFDYDEIHSFSEGLAVVVKGEYYQEAGKVYKEGEKHSFVNKLGKETIMMFERKVMPFQEDLAPVKEGNQWGFIDRNKKIGGIPTQFDTVSQFSESYAAVKTRGRWGFINKKGQYIIEPNYVCAGNFSEGLVNVKKSNKWGYIDASGNTKIEFTYDSTAAFSEELALVKMNDKFGFISKSNEKLIPIKYEQARSFSNGAAAFKTNGKWGFITLNSKKPKPIQGKLTYDLNGKQKPLANAIVKLANHSDSSITDQNGVFILKALEFNENTTLTVIPKNNEKKVVLYSIENEKIGNLTEKDVSSFEYKFLKSDIPKLIVPEEEEVTMIFKGKLLTTVKGKKIPLSNVKVKFSHSEESTTTDQNGDFTLTTENYIEEATLQVETSDKVADVIVANHLGKEIAPMNLITKEQFEYKFLKSEYPKMLVPEEEEVSPVFRGKLLTEKNNVLSPIANATIQFSNGKEKVISDEYGDFELKTYGIESEMILKVVTKADVSNVIITTQGGKEIGKMTSTKEKSFEYKFLKEDLNILLQTEIEEDVEMAFRNADKSGDLIISQPIHYAFGKYELEASSYNTLDKIVKILNENPKVKLEVISHTDASGTDSFNMILSNKRAETVVKYLTSNGVNKKRLSSIGKGETEIRNRCVDNVNCSEKEHEFNRRTEFKFIMN